MNYSLLIGFYSKGLYTDCLEEIGQCLRTLSKEKNTLSQVQVYPSMQLFKIGSTTGQMHQNGAIHGTLLLENFTSDGRVKNFGRSYFLGQPRPDFTEPLTTLAGAAAKMKDFIEEEVKKSLQKKLSLTNNMFPSWPKTCYR